MIGDMSAVKKASRAAAADHLKVDDDEGAKVKAAKAAPSTGAAPFYQLPASTATSTRTRNVFVTIVFALCDGCA